MPTYPDTVLFLSKHHKCRGTQHLMQNNASKFVSETVFVQDIKSDLPDYVTGTPTLLLTNESRALQGAAVIEWLSAQRTRAAALTRAPQQRKQSMGGKRGRNVKFTPGTFDSIAEPAGEPKQAISSIDVQDLLNQRGRASNGADSAA